MCFGTIELFYKDNSIEISNSSLARAILMIKIIRFIILAADETVGGDKIDLTDVRIEVGVMSNIKNKSQIKKNVSRLAR